MFTLLLFLFRRLLLPSPRRSRTPSARAVDVERIVRHLEFLEVDIGDAALQSLVLKLGHASARGTNQMVMGFDVERLLVLGRIAESMLDEQLGVEQKHDGVVERGTADPEIFLLHHEAEEGLDVEVAVDGVDSIEYGKAFRRLAMLVDAKIFGKYLFYSISYIIHVYNNRSYVQKYAFSMKQRRNISYFETSIKNFKAAHTPAHRPDERPTHENDVMTKCQNVKRMPPKTSSFGPGCTVVAKKRFSGLLENPERKQRERKTRQTSDRGADREADARHFPSTLSFR